VPELRILVCVKRVPAPGAQITLTPDARAIDARNLAFTTSPHEECAVETALQLVEAHGGEITVLTVGPADAEEQLRVAISVGAHHAVLVPSAEDPDPQATARAIVDAVRALESDAGPFDLVVFGNESADAGNYQVGIRIAYALGLPVVTGLKGIETGDGRARCEQEVPGGRDIYDVPLPAVVTVKEGLNLPRYPSVPAKLRANRKPVDARAVTRPESKLEKLRLVVPEGQGKQAEILEDASQVVAVLQALGVA